MADGVDVLRVERPADGVACLTLDRPAQRNALSAALRSAIVDALTALAADDAIGAVVLTGAGDAFCAGFDLKELQAGHAADVFAEARSYHRCVFTFAKPLIAAVNGAALAGGMDLAMMCDLRIGGPAAEFGQPQVKAGVPAAFALMRAVLGEAVAREVCLTGARYDASRAEALGMLSRRVDSTAALGAAAIEWAQEIARVRGAKSMKATLVGMQPPLFG